MRRLRLQRPATIIGDPGAVGGLLQVPAVQENGKVFEANSVDAALAAQSDEPGVWAQWRGPHRDGTVKASSWPNRLDDGHLTMLWRQDIDCGYSGPIVGENLVFTVETRDKKREIVRAFDRTSGEQIWETAWTGAMKVPS